MNKFTMMNLAGAAFYSLSVSGSSDYLIGSWIGTYVCNQGLTNVELEIYDSFDSVFRFYGYSDSFGVFDGIFHGVIKQYGQNVTFEPIDDNIAGWFVKPTGSWTTIGFVATLESNGLKMNGNVKEGFNCTTIELSYKEASYDSGAMLLNLPSVLVDGSDRYEAVLNKHPAGYDFSLQNATPLND